MEIEEIIGEAISKEIFKIDNGYEVDYEKLYPDTVGIDICKKENYDDFSKANFANISYVYPYEVKKLAISLQELYDKKINNKEADYENINAEIDKVKEQLKTEIEKTIENSFVTVKMKSIVMPKSVYKKVGIALEILENGKSEKDYKFAGILQEIVVNFIGLVIKQMRNGVRNIWKSVREK